MESIGYLDPSRLLNIPPRHWQAHEFCFFLKDSMVQLLEQYESSGAHTWVTDAFFDAIKSTDNPPEEIDMLSFLREKDLIEPYKFHINSHLVLALTSDMLHFLHEALCCFEKRKFSVAFSLLRKPLKENLSYLCWLIADSEDFISRFSSKNFESMKLPDKDKQLDIYSKTINKLAVSDLFSSDILWNIIHSKNQPAGFEHIWQRATHLVTSYGDLLKTEDYSLNFIFADHSDDWFYDTLYQHLSYVLIFAMQVTLTAFSSILPGNPLTSSHLAITTAGCYEALYFKGNKTPLTNMLNKHLKPFLKCIHCKSDFKILKRHAVSLYLNEQHPCPKCGKNTEVPLYWLFGFCDLTIPKLCLPVG
jgi:hypothetical protein